MSRDTRAALAAVVAVVAVIILGFRFLGSPASQRLIQSDLKTIQALNQLASQIEQKSKSSGNEIPANLDAFPDSAKQDPLTHKNFIYKPKSKTAYDLCATFAAKSPDVEPQGNPALLKGDPWAHPPGDHCFSLDTSEPVPPAPYYY
jgi:hypothetical protein